MVSDTLDFPIPSDQLDAVQRQLAEWLKPYSAKKLARLLSTRDAAVDCRTAERWKSGETMPQARTLAVMVQRWGQPFLSHLYAPLLGVDVDVEARLERVLVEIQAVKEEVEYERKKRGGAFGRSLGAAAAAAGRAAGSGREALVAAGQGVARGVSAGVEAVVRPVRDTAAAAVICLSLSGEPDHSTSHQTKAEQS